MSVNTFKAGARAYGLRAIRVLGMCIPRADFLAITTWENVNALGRNNTRTAFRARVREKRRGRVLKRSVRAPVRRRDMSETLTPCCMIFICVREAKRWMRTCAARTRALDNRR